MLLSKKDHPKEWTLQVLNLQNGNKNVWKMGCGHTDQTCSEVPNELQIGSPASEMETRPLRIFTELCFTFEPETLNDFQVNSWNE